jgi:polyhydroxyalkanoate synthesis regulator phasin
MSSTEERLNVLKMVQEGKISAEEGVSLLEALEKTGHISDSGSQSTAGGNSTFPRWLRIIVTDLDSKKEKYNLRLPANVINAGFKMGARFSPELNGLDAHSILEALQAGETGKVFDVCDENSCQRIEITLEP